jgi:peptidoglycan/xylan/chitin deacetylase (PgdA/CDA1 family)
MSWDHAKEMVSSGMDIGSHTINHAILAHLSEEKQFEEVSNSKKIIEAKLGERIDSFAYPIGGINTYTATTIKALEKAGYIVGFNFVSGINKNVNKNQFEINRFGVDSNRLPIDHLY